MVLIFKGIVSSIDCVVASTSAIYATLVRTCKPVQTRSVACAVQHTADVQFDWIETLRESTLRLFMNELQPRLRKALLPRKIRS